MLVYMEEPIWAFGPLLPEHRDASIDHLLTFLRGLPGETYREMVERALARVHRELRTGLETPTREDLAGWREYIEPVLTTAQSDDVLALLADHEELKARTIGLIEGIWSQGYGSDYESHKAAICEAVARAARSVQGGFASTFVELTENRLPSTLVAGVHDVECVTFSPSYHLGSYVSYTNYAPDLVVYFSAPLYLERTGGMNVAGAHPLVVERDLPRLSEHDMLESLRALSDPNRLRIIELLSAGELYAQEIVGRLSIAQSAVSRHLALLERAGVIRVRPHGGMKYYAVNCERMDALAVALRQCSRQA
jgi:DNA-binding transcriptional ArsR family regulator